MKASEFRRLFTRMNGKRAVQHYAWPGGYPLFMMMMNGDTLCMDCVETERGRIHAAALAPQHRTGWEPYKAEINYESRMWCDNCGQEIESAYEVEDE